MGSIIKVNEYKDFNNNDIMTSDGSGNVTVNAVGLKNTPAFFAHLLADQTISDSASTKITLNNTLVDTNSAFDTSNNRFVVPTNEAGLYNVSASIRNMSSTDFDSFYLYLKKNGSSFLFNGIRSEFRETTSITAVVNLAVADYLEIFCYNGSGGDLDIDGTAAAGDNFCTYLTGHKLIGL